MRWHGLARARSAAAQRPGAAIVRAAIGCVARDQDYAARIVRVNILQVDARDRKRRAHDLIAAIELCDVHVVVRPQPCQSRPTRWLARDGKRNVRRVTRACRRLGCRIECDRGHVDRRCRARSNRSRTTATGARRAARTRTAPAARVGAAPGGCRASGRSGATYCRATARLRATHGSRAAFARQATRW